jgi:hypothetical protein
MRALLLLLLLAMAGCGGVDVSPGASGFPDTIMTGPNNIPRGIMNTDGTVTLNRELPFGSRIWQ